MFNPNVIVRFKFFLRLHTYQEQTEKRYKQELQQAKDKYCKNTDLERQFSQVKSHNYYTYYFGSINDAEK